LRSTTGVRRSFAPPGAAPCRLPAAARLTLSSPNSPRRRLLLSLDWSARDARRAQYPTTPGVRGRIRRANAPVAIASAGRSQAGESFRGKAQAGGGAVGVLDRRQGTRHRSSRRKVKGIVRKTPALTRRPGARGRGSCPITSWCSRPRDRYAKYPSRRSEWFSVGVRAAALLGGVQDSRAPGEGRADAVRFVDQVVG